MSTFFIAITAFFWLLLIYYSLLTVAGILFKSEKRERFILNSYPSVSIFIPAYNEEAVLATTLDAMVKLNYPGELTIYVLNDNSLDRTGEIGIFYARLFPHIRTLLCLMAHQKKNHGY